MAIKSGMLSGSLVVEEKALNLIMNIDIKNDNHNIYILLLVGVVVFSLLAIYKLIKLENKHRKT